MISCFSDLVNKLVKERDADAPTKIVKDDNQVQAMTIDYKMSKYNHYLRITIRNCRIVTEIARHISQKVDKTAAHKIASRLIIILPYFARS